MERTRRFAVTALGAVTLSTVLGVPQHPRVTEPIRSEEHTSELQSPCNLVCRLLLGKKKHTSELQSPCNNVCRLLLEKKYYEYQLRTHCANGYTSDWTPLDTFTTLPARFSGVSELS